MKPGVSVLMPFRDAAATIGPAVRSVLGQEGVDLELLAVDDQSVDDSADQVASFRDPRIRLIPNEGPAGIVGALETARRHARAPILARMDADDLSHPHRLLVQIKRLNEANDSSVVSCGVEILDSQGPGMDRHVGWVNALQGHQDISNGRFVECPMVHPSVVMRAEALERVGGYREVPWAEDHDLWLRMLEAGHRFEKVPEVLFQWRDSPRRLTRRDRRYGDGARMAMRCHYLARLPRVARWGVSIAGAGPIGKRLAIGLKGLGVTVHGFFEVHPRRIGERIHGVPVVDSGGLADRWRESVLLGAVGVPGGRERVRRLAEAAGRVEGGDFWSVC